MRLQCSHVSKRNPDSSVSIKSRVWIKEGIVLRLILPLT